jgi:hypothetical protein
MAHKTKGKHMVPGELSLPLLMHLGISFVSANKMNIRYTKMTNSVGSYLILDAYAHIHASIINIAINHMFPTCLNSVGLTEHGT